VVSNQGLILREGHASCTWQPTIGAGFATKDGIFLHSARGIISNFPCNQISLLLIQSPYVR
jgi:hypothetical protein